jgi:hypothetical protein
MYFHSRLRTLQAQPEKANEVLQKALMMKLEYLQVSMSAAQDQAALTNPMFCPAASAYLSRESRRREQPHQRR